VKREENNTVVRWGWIGKIVAGVVITANLLTDIAYCLIDPRISYQ